MQTFVCSWTILPDQATREACMTLFGGMTPKDDEQQLGSVELLGRWSVVGEAKGYAVVRAREARDVQSFLAPWIPMADITVTPVLTDDEQRTLLLGTPPDWSADETYDVGAAPAAGESLYVVQYQFRGDASRAQGFETFAAMTQAQDRNDAGACTALGRWHVPSEGRGYAVASAPTVAALYRWAHNWNTLCDCRVEPVTRDEVTRSILRAQAGFAERHAALVAALPPPPGPCFVGVRLEFRDSVGRQDFLDLLAGPEGLDVTRSYDGCESVEILAGDEPLVLHIQSKWTSRAKHDAYMAYRKETGLFDTVVDLLATPFTMTHRSAAM